MKRRVVTLAVLVAMMAFSPVVYAVPLAPGGTVVPLELTDAAGTEILAARVFTTFDSSPFSPPITGTFVQEVYRIAAGTLDFYYQFSNTTSQESIAQNTNASFAGFTTDVFFRKDDPDGAGPLTAVNKPPLTASRDAGGISTNFDFGLTDTTKVGPGQTSSILVIRTNATAFGPGASSLINGSTADVNPDKAPATAAVPEPASLLLLGSGFLALGAYRARLRAAQKR